MYEGSTITLSPWAAQALSDDERNAIARRLVELKARLVASRSPREHAWVIRVSSWAMRDGRPVIEIERRPYFGLHFAACIAEALTEYERTWEPEELLTVAAQSGMAVSRG
jgi:glutathione S-transferase